MRIVIASILAVGLSGMQLGMTQSAYAQSADEVLLAEVKQRCDIGQALSAEEQRQCEEEWCELVLRIGSADELEAFITRFPVGTSACWDLAFNAIAREQGGDGPEVQSAPEAYPGGGG